MRRSLQRRLTLMLGGTILLAALIAALAAFVLAYREAAELQDDLLRQIAVLVDPDGPAGLAAGASPRPALSDPDSRISVIRLPLDPRPDWLLEGLSPGFHRLDRGNDTLRVFVRETGDPGRRIVVAQPTEARDETALTSALQILVPLLLLLPVIAWLVVRIVRSELAPIAHLATHLDAQPADRPEPMPQARLPDEVRPFAEAIDRLLARVAGLVQQQRRFIADAAHEIRSPLTALSLQAQNLRGAKTLEAARERMLPLEAGIERARRLTEQLLSLARVQAGPRPPELIDCYELGRTLIAEHVSIAEVRGIDLGLDAQQIVHVLAAPDTLRLVLRNGLENALKYAPEGGEVTLRITVHAGQAIIEVVDNGPGIPVAERKRAMEPFHRLGQASAEGSGLGLSIAREAAASLGGTLELVQRTDGPGLVFRYRQRVAH